MPQSSPRLIAGDARALGRVLHNDLQEPALTLRPTLRDVLDAGVPPGPSGGIVSGSGPTVAFLVADPAAAARVHAALSRAWSRSARPSRTTGPAPGARVIAGADSPARSGGCRRVRPGAGPGSVVMAIRCRRRGATGPGAGGDDDAGPEAELDGLAGRWPGSPTRRCTVSTR